MDYYHIELKHFDLDNRTPDDNKPKEIGEKLEALPSKEEAFKRFAHWIKFFDKKALDFKGQQFGAVKFFRKKNNKNISTQVTLYINDAVYNQETKEDIELLNKYMAQKVLY